MSSPTHDLPDVMRADMEYIASKIESAGASPSPVASTALLPALATNNSQGCWLNASRPTMAMR